MCNVLYSPNTNYLILAMLNWLSVYSLKVTALRQLIEKSLLSTAGSTYRFMKPAVDMICLKYVLLIKNLL